MQSWLRQEFPGGLSKIALKRKCWDGQWVVLLGAVWQGPASCLIVALPTGAGAWDERREEHRPTVHGPTNFLVVDLVAP